ncbi:Uncharacterised protein [uncultured archaeon]|nr:Uncharacterised protein [uncultured archaeon]
MSIKKNLLGLIAASCLAFSSGCASYKVSTPDYIRPDFQEYLTDYQNDSLRDKAKEHFLYRVVPLSSEQIKPYDVGHWITWNLFGNENNGIFGEDCKKPYSSNINTWTFLRWQARNPASNLCKYTLGKRTEERNGFAILRANDKFLVLHKDKDPCIFSSTKASFNLSLNHCKPFLAFKFPVFPNRRFDFYFGWRPDNTFGMKLRPFTDDGLW